MSWFYHGGARVGEENPLCTSLDEHRVSCRYRLQRSLAFKVTFSVVPVGGKGEGANISVCEWKSDGGSLRK